MYTLHITLRDCPHPCYRVLEVNNNLTLYDLSWAINLAFGWNSTHLCDFLVKGKAMYGIDPEGEEYASEPYFMAQEVTVHEAFKNEKAAIYHYDYGDSWKHDIRIEYSRRIGEKVSLIEGKGVCPPDDCGGIGGYTQMLETMRNPKSEEAQEYLQWLGDYPLHPEPWPEPIAQYLIAKLDYFLATGLHINDFTHPIFEAWIMAQDTDWLEED